MRVVVALVAILVLGSGFGVVLVFVCSILWSEKVERHVNTNRNVPSALLNCHPSGPLPRGTTMRGKFVACCLAGMSLVLTASVAFPKDQEVAMESLPDAVRKTATKESQGATVRGVFTETEHGKTSYELELTVNGRSRDVLIASDGSVTQVEEDIAITALPGAVREAFEREAEGGTILKVEAVTRGGKLAQYEGRVRRRDGTKREVEVGLDGKRIPKGGAD